MTIRSMTGYGQAAVELGTSRVTVELRSLNHRFADIRLRLPSELAEDEREIRRKILGSVKRGRLELTVNVVPISASTSRPQLNRELVEEVLAAGKSLSGEFGLHGTADLATVLSLPGMFRPASVELEWDESQREALHRSLDQALRTLLQDREREGRHLQEELQQRLAGMVGIAERIREHAAKMPEQVRDRLLERIRGLVQDVDLDPARLAQEALVLADRADVTEEMTRLAAHLQQAESLLEGADGEPVGKRLDFLLQEIHRETNTINSKSAGLELSREALAMKAELEKFREQVQNLE